jgi:AraC-like DNA-binding protein
VSARFTIGDGYAMYRGATTPGVLHRHAAFQVVVGIRGPVSVVDATGFEHRAAALVIPPMQRHCLLASPDVVTYFVEPHCALADRLRLRYGNGISAALELRELTEDDLRPLGRSEGLDPRLVVALDALTDKTMSLPELAALVGVSPQRLRALARQQLGMSLARWRVWTRLRRAAEAILAGQPLAEAAVTAGFADQAHLTRQTREMMGLTPAAMAPIVRSHSLRAT